MYEAEGDTWMDLPAVRQLRGLHHDVVLVPLFGHTRGHTGVVVRRGARWVVHAGDAYFHHDELVPGRRPPLGLRLFAAVDEVDRSARLASVAALQPAGRARRRRRGLRSRPGRARPGGGRGGLTARRPMGYNRPAA